MKRDLLVSMIVITSLGLLARGDTEQDSKDIQGKWIPLAAELSTKKYPDEVLKTMELVMADGKYTVKVGGQLDEGTVKLDASTTPKAIDIMGTEGPNKGRTILAIYELKGDTLRICYDLGGKARPAEFKTEADRPLFLVTYKRDKP